MYDVHRSIHQIPLAVACDAADVAGLVARRLAGFPVDGGEGELVIEVATPRRSPAIRRPSDVRVVHETAEASVTYSDTLDELWLEYGGHGVACCRASAGWARIEVDRRAEVWPWIATRPLLTICLLELLKRRGLYGIHAASAAQGSDAVLVAGPSGSGKSTISLSLLLAGWSLLGDDIVFLRDRGDGVDVLGFPDEIAATDETFGLLAGLGRPEDWPQLGGYAKRLLSPDALASDPPASPVRPRLALLPHIGEADAPSAEAVGADTLLRALVPNVLLTHGAASQANLDVLARLARQVDGFRLVAGRRLETLPAFLSTLLERVAA